MGAKPRSLGYFLGAALQGRGACPEVPSSGARGLRPQTAHPRTGQRAAPTAPCPEACEPPAQSLGLPLGMAAAEGVGGKWCAEKGLFYCKYLESTS